MNIDDTTRRLNRLRRVALHIDRHLFEPLRLAELADVAALSVHHFDRVFAAYAGETPLARVRRLRLEHAHRQLMLPQAPAILPLALDCGYGSPEAFARAFRRQFGAPPSSLPRQATAAVHRPAAAFRLCRLPPLDIQYLTFDGPLDDTLQPFDELRARAIMQGVPREQRKGWAVSLDGRIELHGEQAGLRVALLSQPLGRQLVGLETGQLPPGRYAVFDTRGGYEAPARAALAQALATHGGWRLANGPVLRRFDNPMYLPAAHERRAMLFVPIVR
jgi:AraC family transcriptional regulator